MKFWSMPAGLSCISQMGQTGSYRVWDLPASCWSAYAFSQLLFKHQHFIWLETLLLAMIFKHELWSRRAPCLPCFHCSRLPRMVSERKLGLLHNRLSAFFWYEFCSSIYCTVAEKPYGFAVNLLRGLTTLTTLNPTQSTKCYVFEQFRDYLIVDRCINGSSFGFQRHSRMLAGLVLS